MIEINNEAALLKLLNAQMSCLTFKEDKTLLEASKLPFYNDYVLVRAKTFATMPSVEFFFLWNQRRGKVIKIDGTRNCFFDNIDELKPIITPQTAVAYVKFVLGNVWDENGAIKLCEKVSDIEFSSRPTQNEQAFLNEKVKPAMLTPQSGMIIVSCNIVYGKALYRAIIKLQTSGKFHIFDEKQLGEEIEALRTIFLR